MIEEFRGRFPVKNVQPYGECIIVPAREFQHDWEVSLEGEGHRVFSNSYNGKMAFFIRLSKSKPKSVSRINHKSSSSPRSSLGFPNYHGNRVRITKNPGGANKKMSSERQYKLIPIDTIKSSASPSREIFEDIDCLAETIKRHGLIHPVVVKKDIQRGWVIVTGERRFRACQRAGLTEVPCILVDGDLTEEQILEMQLAENVARDDLKIFEQVRLVEILRKRFDLNYEEIAIKTGLSHGTVQNYLTTAKLPEQYVRMIGRDRHNPTQLTITKALILARANLPADKLKEITELIKRKGLSRANLAKKLAQRPSSKIKRVRESKVYWKELTKSLREYARYWSDYCELKEWEDIDSYHLQLNVKLPKDLQELEEPN